MHLRKPRLKIKSRGYWADTLALCHPKMLVIIFFILTLGHFLSPSPVDLARYGLATGGVLIAVLGAYRFNELNDRTSATSIPRMHQKALAIVFTGIAMVCAIILAWLYVWWILALAIIGVGLIVLYNLDVSPIIHNRPVYALTWGALPLIFSEMTQSLNLMPTPASILFGGWAGFVAIYTLWLWGPTTCGRMSVCSRIVKSKYGGFVPCTLRRNCHSPVLKCEDRVAMPREVNDHQKVLINLNITSIFFITFSVVYIRVWGFV
jgi:heme O synthase-like polyprenyltransferase